MLRRKQRKQKMLIASTSQVETETASATFKTGVSTKLTLTDDSSAGIGKVIAPAASGPVTTGTPLTIACQFGWKNVAMRTIAFPLPPETVNWRSVADQFWISYGRPSA